MGIELKRRAPRANTILEAVRIRFGTPAHLVFFAYGVSVQILITASLLLGGSAAFTVTTGANIVRILLGQDLSSREEIEEADTNTDYQVAMNYLIPLGVVIYTYLGGLKSTFLSDYIQYGAYPVSSFGSPACSALHARGLTTVAAPGSSSLSCLSSCSRR